MPPDRSNSPEPARGASAEDSRSPTTMFWDKFLEKLASTGEIPDMGPPPYVPPKTPPPTVYDAVASFSRLTLDQVPSVDTRVVFSSQLDPEAKHLNDSAFIPFQIDNNPGKLYAIEQSSNTAFCSFVFRGQRYTFNFDPSSDNLIIQNTAEDTIYILPIGGDDVSGEDWRDIRFFTIEPQGVGKLGPGPWRLFCQDHKAKMIAAADIFIFRRRYVVSKRHGEIDPPGSKRNRLSVDSGAPSKRARSAVPNTSHGRVFIGDPPKDLNSPEPSSQLVEMENPLERLEAGQELSISNASTACPDDQESPSDAYTLVYKTDVAKKNFFSSTFSARHSILGDVSVKIIRTKTEPQYLSIPLIAQQWKNEQALLRHIDHEFILGFLGSDARFHSIYMEYLPFPNLASPPWKSSKTHHFEGSIHDCRRVLQNMASALSYLHKHSIIHNDIKPSNILFDSDRGAVLVDFSLASQNPYEICRGGTPWYVPPEYLHSRVRDTSGDVFALGVTMLYLQGKIALPDLTQPSWNIRAARFNHCEKQKMEDWLRTVAYWKKAISIGNFGGVIARMLDDDPSRRVKARSIRPWVK